MTLILGRLRRRWKPAANKVNWCVPSHSNPPLLSPKIPTLNCVFFFSFPMRRGQFCKVGAEDGGIKALDFASNNTTTKRRKAIIKVNLYACQCRGHKQNLGWCSQKPSLCDNCARLRSSRTRTNWHIAFNLCSPLILRHLQRWRCGHGSKVLPPLTCTCSRSSSPTTLTHTQMGIAIRS